MTTSRRAQRSIAAVLVIGCAVSAAGFIGVRVGRRYESNTLCCPVPRSPTLHKMFLSVKEALHLASYNSIEGQDKWVLENVFPGVTDGVFLDVGSFDGFDGSNSAALERKGWTGICIDPFPTNMETRTCQMFKEVVFSTSGEKVKFRTAGATGGIEGTLGAFKADAETSPAVELTTVTLGDILDRAKAPRFIHYMSIDIEGAEYEALRGVPFDKYSFGAFTIEHNYESQKRDDIKALLESHGYQRVHTWYRDDFYLPTDRKLY